MPGVGQQCLDHLELFRAGFLDLQFPLLGQDWQGGEVPALVLFAIGFRLGLFQQVPEAPCHGDAPALQVAVATPIGVQHAGNVACLAGFFTQIKYRGFHYCCHVHKFSDPDHEFYDPL